MTGIEIWTKCKFGTAFGYAIPDAVKMMDEIGEVETFGCTNSEVIKNGRYQVVDCKEYEDNSMSFGIATLHGTGNKKDPAVSAVLDKICGICPNFQRSSVTK